MAQDDLDLVCHLGDYIYEYEAGRNGTVRTHAGPEITTLGGYRVRHAQYRADPLLHGMHAACPWLVTWDDHEFDNNCADDVSEETGVDATAFLERRANAYQAYYEAMPLRSASRPRGADMRLYRRTRFGDLADFLVLDTRQYRDDQPNGDRRSPLNDAAVDPARSMLGRTQKSWLCGELLTSRATWNVLAQQVMMGLVSFPPAKPKEGAVVDASAPRSDERRYSMDQWGGYVHERAELLRFCAEHKVANPVVLTGDIHANFVNELRVDDADAKAPIVATEFVGTSISSGGDGSDASKELAALQAFNPGLRFLDRRRGYVLCEVTKDEWRSDYRTVDVVTKPGGSTRSAARFTVRAGRPGIAAG
jgi:alkaline phosphatase D